MKIISKASALLTAAGILSAASLRAFPVLPASSLHTRSLSRFMHQTAALPQPEAPFSSLRYNAEEQQLYCDGRPVGSAFGDFRVSGGTVCVRGAVAGQPEKSFVPLSECAEAFGCEIEETESGSVIRSPFQSCRLIARSDAEIEAPQQLVNGDIRILCYDSPAETYAAYRRLQSDSRIREISPDGIVYIGAASEDYDINRYSWGRTAIGADQFTEWLKAERDFLPEIKVAVIDTGLYTDHEWFTGRIAEGGISFAGTDDFTDGHSHGTHCSGIIVQSTPENVKILPIKALADSGYATDTNIYCAMMYAVEQKSDIISMSLGGEGMNWLTKEAVQAADAADIPVIVSAGNESRDTGYGALTGFDSCVTISALSQNYDTVSGQTKYELAYYSDFGSNVDFCAPGSRIHSAVAAPDNAVEMMSGTSMAAPFAAAAYADLRSYDPGLTSAEIYTLLKANALDLGESGFDEFYGWGMVDLSAFRFSVTFVPPPAILPAVVNQTNPFTVTINAPADTEVYYTLDDSEPTPETGILYEEPFMLEASAIVRAAAFSDGRPSRTVRQAYCIENADVISPYLVSDGVLNGYTGVRTKLDLSADFPDGSLNAIGDDAFANSRITEITLPDSVTSIGDRAFYASDLKTLTANGVTAVGCQAFMDSALETANLGALDSLGALAFFRCEKLRTLSCSDDISLRSIPDYAFAQCNRLNKLPFAWETVAEIGAHAFENCKGINTVALPVLRSLGDAAFAHSSILSLTLPESQTVLPARVLNNTPLESLSAHGVTEIGTEALANLDKPALSLDIDLSRITKLGNHALDGLIFDTPVNFDSLTECGTGALDHSSAPNYTFPLLRQITSEMFDELQGPILLAGAEEISDAALIRCTDGIFVGDALRSLAGNPIFYEYADDESLLPVTGGPADSLLRDYAEANGLTYLTLPAVYPADGDAITASQFDTVTLRVHSVSTEPVTLKWFTVTDEKETEIAGADAETYQPDTSRAGTFCFRAAMYQESKRISETDLTLTLMPAEQLSLLSDECAVIDWAIIAAKSDPAQNELRTVLEYIPVYDGSYYVTVSDIVPDAAPPKIISGDSMTVGSIINNANEAIVPVTLKAGVSYHIIQDLPRFADIDPDISLLRISQTAPRSCEDLSDYAFDPFSAVSFDPNYNGENAPDITYSTLTAESAADDIIRLVPDTDYIIYSRMLEPDRIDLCFILTGSFFDARITHYSAAVYPISGQIECGSVQNVSSNARTASYLFIPPETAEYEFLCGIREPLINQALASGIYDPEFWMLPEIHIFSDNGSDIPLAATGGNVMRASLTAGAAYHISLGSIAAYDRYTLCIQPADGSVSPFENVSGAFLLPDDMTTEEELFVFDGNPVTPELALYDGSRKLNAGSDYDVFYLSNTAPGEMAAVAVSRGDVTDYLLLTQYISQPLSADIPETIYADSALNAYMFRADTDGYYSVMFSAPANGTAVVRINGELLPPSPAEYPAAAEYLLKANGLLYITVSQCDGDAELLIRNARSISGGVLIPETDYYLTDSDDPTPPCRLTLPDGTHPEYGKDFTVSSVYRDGDAAAVICATGTGDYAGCLTAALPIAFRAETDIPYTVTGLPEDNDFCTCLFTPKHSGSYTIRTFASPAVYHSAALTNYYDTDQDTSVDTLLRITDENGIFLGSNDSFGGNSFAGLEVQLYAGTKYCIQISNRNPRNAAYISYGFIILDQKQLLSDMSIKTESSELTGTALPPLTVTAKDGSLLKEGIDYVTQTIPCAKVKDLCLLAEGIGNYTGYAAVMLHTVLESSRVTENGAPTDAEIEINVPFAHSRNQYFFRLFQSRDLKLLAADGDAVSGWLTDLSNPLSSFQISDEEPVNVESGQYVLRIADEPDTDPLYSRVVTLAGEKTMISETDISVSNVQYTGALVCPPLTVSDHGKLLHEDIDYVVWTYSDLTGCGRHELMIEGIGRYCGSASAEFFILPAQSSGTLTAGTYAFDITEPGSAVCKDWTPQTDRCFISKSNFCDSVVTVFDSSGRSVCELYGAGRKSAEIETVPHQTYRICVRLYSSSMTGTADLTVLEDYRLLNRCDVQIGELRNGQLPKYAVYDGETLLTEGTDYLLRSDLAGDTAGTGFLQFTGLGLYSGELVWAYEVSPAHINDPLIDAEAADSETALHCNELRHIIRGRSGAQRIFSFTAPADGSYSLILPDLYEAMTAYVYLPDGSRTDDTKQISLHAGETLRILCITNIFSPVDEFEYYQIGVQSDVPGASKQFSADGLLCEFRGSDAVVTALEAEMTGIFIPEVFTDPADGTEYSFGGISSLLCSTLAGTHTIFGETGGAVEQFCLEHGLCFAAVDPLTGCTGDVSGDGILSMDDILTITRWINECPGMQLSDAAIALADCNADGILDGMDLRILLESIS
ncbi:MAG: S8 family serine peptidase [Oscillospiraceae bacterium]|nr:S8 family serine peptidase [Oscillospiraceae bacterium]